MKVLIGGAALVELGSSRRTSDTDYLVNDITTKEMFIFDTENNIDYINANGHKFFSEIFEIEKENEVASPQSLLELKAFSFVQHLKNMNWKKVADCEFDMAFLVREYNCVMPTIVKKYVQENEYNEIVKEISQIRK